MKTYENSMIFAKILAQPHGGPVMRWRAQDGTRGVQTTGGGSSSLYILKYI